MKTIHQPLPPKPIRVVTGCLPGVILLVILLVLLQASSYAAPNRLASASTACLDFLNPPPGVGVDEIRAVAGQWRALIGDPDYVYVYDVNSDGVINVVDISLIGNSWDDICGSLPVSGIPVPELVAFDQAMQDFMGERSIEAGTLAVMKEGRLVLYRGYGWQDPEHQQTLPPDTLMRIASVTKPITAAAIKHLFRQGQLSPDTPVFPLLEITPPPGQTPDPRLNDITVQHLLDHQGGCDRDATFDPMFRSIEIAEALGIPSPPSSWDIARYMAGQPLQFTPGTQTVYSNFGYSLLGRVIEKVTGQTYVAYIQENILAPLGIEDIMLGRTLPAFRDPREIWYSDPYWCRNVFEPDSSELVPCPDGGFYLEAMDSHGGLIASGEALVHFLQAYWISGEPRLPDETGYVYWFFGSLPGTFSLAYQRPAGVNIAVLFNQRTDPSGLSYDVIKEVMDQATDGVQQWPTD